MHDVLVHYLEVNFPEIAEQLAHAHGREPSNEERAAAAERLRELIRRLRRGAEGAGAPPHTTRTSAAEVIPGAPRTPHPRARTAPCRRDGATGGAGRSPGPRTDGRRPADNPAGGGPAGARSAPGGCQPGLYA